jgi:hypothetical protein
MGEKKLADAEYSQLLSRISDLDQLQKGDPFKGSVWKKHLSAFWFDGVTTSMVHPRRAAFLTGGQLKCNWKTFLLSFPAYAADIMNGVVITASEIAYSHEGIRVFFELDYRCTFIPTPDTIEEHVRLAQSLVRDTFKHSDVTVHVLQCDPKLKTKRTGEIVIATGVHIIFENVVTTTEILRKLALTLDARITASDHRFGTVVDDAVVHAETASLRMPYAYKAERCMCRKTSKTRSLRKRKYADIMRSFVPDMDLDTKNDNGVEYPSSDVEEEEQQERCEECKNGYILHQSIYIPVYTLHADGIKSAQIESLPIEQQLQKICITPVHAMVDTHSTFSECVDMVQWSDIRPMHGSVLFKTDRFLTKNKTTTNLSRSEHVELYRLVTELLRSSLGESSRFVVVSSLCRTKQQSLFVHLKGRDSMLCPFKQSAHKSDRSYFILCMRSHTLLPRCHNVECSKIIKESGGKKGSLRIPKGDLNYLSILKVLKVTRVHASGVEGGYIAVQPPCTHTDILQEAQVPCTVPTVQHTSSEHELANLQLLFGC